MSSQFLKKKGEDSARRQQRATLNLDGIRLVWSAGFLRTTNLHTEVNGAPSAMEAHCVDGMFTCFSLYGEQSLMGGMLGRNSAGTERNSRVKEDALKQRTLLLLSYPHLQLQYQVP